MAVVGTTEEQQETHNGGSGGGGGIISLRDRAAWRAALGTRRPVLAHLNADTTWLLQLPVPSTPSSNKRSRYNILVDPWLQGPQSDVASWFSTQWHVVAPTVHTMRELEEVLAELEGEGGKEEGKEEGKGGPSSHIDCVAISHEFTDHCHQATLLELPKSVPVVATDKAADLVRSWNHFETVITTPGLSASPSSPSKTTTTTASKTDWRDAFVADNKHPSGTLPPWLRIGRVITPGNSLYYHSAVIIAFDLSSSSHGSSSSSAPEAVIYSPHGIQGSDLRCVPAAGLRTLALLHGLDDVRIWAAAQLNLGAHNGLRAVRASGARYWVATHDEVKKGGGFISWLLRRRTYSLRDAVEADAQQQQQKAKGERDDGGEEEDGHRHYDFVGLGSGQGMLLAQT